MPIKCRDLGAINQLERQQLQDGPSPYFTEPQLAAIGSQVGVDSDRLALCLGDTMVRASIQSHMRFGYDHRVNSVPRIYAVPVVSGAPQYYRALQFDGDKDIEVWIRLLNSAEPNLRETL